MIRSQKIRTKLYSPIRFYYAYIGATLLISLLGPAEYEDYHKGAVLFYMAAFLAVLHLGYWIGLHLHNNDTALASGHEDTRTIRESKILKLTKLSIIISGIGIMLFIASDIRTGTLGFSLGSIGSNYINRDSFGGRGYPIEYLYRFFTGIFRYMAMSFSILYYKKLNRGYRYLFWSFCLLFFLENCVRQGSQKSAFDLLLFIGGTWLLSRYRSDRLKVPKKYLLVLALFSFLFLLYLSYNQYLRYSQIGVTAENYGLKSTSGMSFNTNHIIFRIFGDKLGFGLASILCGYLSAGYYGLSLCLSLPFKWTYGAGSALIFSKVIERLFGYYAYDDTYLARMTTVFGRNGMTSWNTIFPWLASDLTFLGVLVLFFFVGILFSYTWKEFYCHANPFSLLMFMTLCLGLAFVPANNQLFTGIDGFISTWCIIIVWTLQHKRYNFCRQGHA